MAEVLIETAGPGNLQGRPQAVPWKRGVPQVFGWCLLIYCRQLYFVPQDLPQIQRWCWWDLLQILVTLRSNCARTWAWRRRASLRLSSRKRREPRRSLPTTSNAVNTTTTIIVIIAKIAIIIVIIAMTKHHYWKDRSRSKEQSARDLAAGEAVAGWQTRRTNEKHLIIQFS